MKLNLKITGRERWALALAPAVAIVGIYLFGFHDSLSAELVKQQKRVQTAQTPLPPPPPSATLAKAKSALEDAKREIAEKGKHVAELQESIATATQATATANDESAPARIIENVEAVFSRNGITPLISEPADGSVTGNQPPATLVALLAPKMEGDPAGSPDSRIWHCVFDGPTAKFERAVKELAVEAPTVVPLSLNLVYNPENDGETRLLELWLVY